MIIIIIIILLALIVYKLYTLDCKYENMTQLEHMQSTTNPESVCNIASLYNNEMLSVSNATITKDLKAESVTTNALISSSFNLLPRGIIVAWNGGITIPNGWILCDGANGSGTPDLRDKFILGAGTIDAIGTTGGAPSVTLSIEQLPPHIHSSGFVTKQVGSDGKSLNLLTNASYTGSAPFNRHTSYTGTGAPVSIMPPYYALIYIMKS